MLRRKPPGIATVLTETMCYVCPCRYKEMVKRKTGGLFGLAVRLMQQHSKSTADYTRVLDLLGLHFQIRDDYANLKSAQYADQKSFAEDLTEGKFSFPIIHSIRANPTNRELSSILRQRTEDLALKRYAIECVDRTGSFEYTRGVLLALERETLQEIKKLGGNPLLVKIIVKLAALYKDADPRSPPVTPPG
jgi:geranylgeranyl diphosphate synthase type 3